MQRVLGRTLKNRHVELIALGGIIGSAYFLGSGYIISELGPCAFLGYILGGIIAYLTTACLAELAMGMRQLGSFVSYSAQLISPAFACGVGWSYWLSWVVYIPSECLAGGIIMHYYMPDIPTYVFAFLFGIVITWVNVLKVKFFGELEFWLALIKILALVMFSVVAILIFTGVLNFPTKEVVGMRFFLHDGGIFPHGVAILFLNMVVLLTNFQGSEIIGLSATEAEKPEVAIPSALKKVSYRIVGLYLVPTFLLTLIFPWQEANLKGTIFAEALAHYGLYPIAHLFSFVVIAAALSCANSGLYASVRALHGLSVKKLAPKMLGSLSASATPRNATLATLLAIWSMLLLSYFFAEHQLYTNLLAISGFTGSMAWIAICWSQVRFRRKLSAAKVLALPYRVPGYPYTPLISIWLQILCLVVVAWSSTLRAAFYLGVPAMLGPMIFYWLRTRYKTSS